MLEIGRSDDMDFSRIVEVKQCVRRHEEVKAYGLGQCEAEAEFVDDPEIPPLE